MLIYIWHSYLLLTTANACVSGGVVCLALSY